MSSYAVQLQMCVYCLFILYDAFQGFVYLEIPLSSSNA